MTIRPLHDRVLIRRLDQEEKSAGGIVLPDSAKEKPIMGTVVAIGPGKAMDSGAIQALSVAVDDKVLFGKYAGTEVSHAGEDLLVMREEDIVGIVD